MPPVADAKVVKVTVSLLNRSSTDSPTAPSTSSKDSTSTVDDEACGGWMVYIVIREAISMEVHRRIAD